MCRSLTQRASSTRLVMVSQNGALVTGCCPLRPSRRRLNVHSGQSVLNAGAAGRVVDLPRSLPVRPVHTLLHWPRMDVRTSYASVPPRSSTTVPPMRLSRFLLPIVAADSSQSWNSSVQRARRVTLPFSGMQPASQVYRICTRFRPAVSRHRFMNFPWCRLQSRRRSPSP